MQSRRKHPYPIKAIDLGAHSGRLLVVAFSDYRVQDIELLVEELSKLQPRPDLILYAGDDIERFRPSGGKNLFEAIASQARYGLCAVVGNDDEPSVRKLVSGKSVKNVHLSPVTLGAYAILGLDGAPRRPDLDGIGYILHSEQEIARHLNTQRQVVAPRQFIVVSHAPPEGILDHAVRFSKDGKPRSIGSRALKKFVKSRKEVVLVVCGHVHRCGGMNQHVFGTTVVNAANHDDYKAVARFAIIELGTHRKPIVEWRELRPVSIVPDIGPASVERLREIGIRTIEELAGSSTEVVRVTCPPFLVQS
ncbi:MAG: metallophosphoesterase [Candidatus Acidiferrales bacterium]